MCFPAIAFFFLCDIVIFSNYPINRNLTKGGERTLTTKKKIIIGITIVLLLVLSCAFLYPLSFKNVISNTDDLYVVYTETGVTDGMAQQESTEYQFASDSEEIQQILQILQKYSYHRSLRSMSGNSSLDGNKAGYWLKLYSNDNNIICGGTNEIIVNDHVYHIGYLGNQKALSLMEEIRSVIMAK